MRPSTLSGVLTLLAAIAVPVTLSLEKVYPVELGGALMIVCTGLCLVMAATRRFRGMMVPLVVLLLEAAALWGVPAGGEWYPVLVSLALASVCTLSIFSGRTVIARMAEAVEGPLAPHQVHYCRRVTVMWIAFFICNAMVATLTVLADDPTIWFVYNGIVSYVLIGLLIGGEYLVRQKVKRRHYAGVVHLVVGGLLLVACCPAVVVAEVPAGFTRLMNRLESRSEVKQTFTQRRFVPGLRRPLVSEGVLLYQRGHHIEWITCSPLESTAVITAEGVIESRDGKMEVSSQDPLQSRMASFLMALFAGDSAAVQDIFTVGYSESDQGFSVQLRPLSTMVAEVLTRVDLRGEEWPRTLELVFSGRDRIVLDFAPTNSSRCPQEP